MMPVWGSECTSLLDGGLSSAGVPWGHIQMGVQPPQAGQPPKVLWVSKGDEEPFLQGKVLVQSQGGTEHPAHPVSSPRALSTRWLVPHVTGAAWPWGRHPEPQGHGVQIPTGMTPQALWWWQQEPDGSCNQSPMGMATRVLWRRHPVSLGHGTQISMVMAPRSSRRWHPDFHEDGIQSPMEKAPNVP